MRRATILRLLGVVLLLAFAVYSAFWWVAAGRIKLAAGDWAQAARAKQLNISWQSIAVSGYPFSFRIELGGAVLADKAANPPIELRAPQLSATVWPWDVHTVRLAAPDPINVLLGPATAPLATLVAASADGTVAAGAEGGAAIWFTLYQPKADAPVALAARAARGWIIVPPHPPTAPADPAVGLAVLVEGFALPVPPPELPKTIDEIGVGATVMGVVQLGPLKAAAAAWRDAGGVLRLDQLALRWGALGVTGSGTLALDGEMQPVGGVTAAISGYDQLMSALVAAGRIKASDARVARLALAMLGRVGPDGRPEISTSLRLQDGEMFLGPAKLGRAPRIEW